MAAASRPTRQSGVRELRQNLSRYLERVKERETLTVTETRQVDCTNGPTSRTRTVFGRVRDAFARPSIIAAVRVGARAGAVLIVTLALGVVLPSVSRAAIPIRRGVYQALGKWPQAWESPYPLVDGVPFVDYQLFGFSAYNPVTIDQFGLISYSLWIRYGEPSRLSAAENAAGWLVTHQLPNGTWPYSFPWTPAGGTETLEPGWTSALAQGQALSLLERIYQLNPRKVFLETMRRALRPLATYGPNGLKRLFLGGVYFEEYPTKAVNFTLNGDAQTIIGLYDTSNLFPLAKKLFEQGIHTLERDVSGFDSGYGLSIYSVAYPHFPPPNYDPLIVDEMRVLAEITGAPVFGHYAEEWSRE